MEETYLSKAGLWSPALSQKIEVCQEGLAQSPKDSPQSAGLFVLFTDKELVETHSAEKEEVKL